MYHSTRSSLRQNWLHCHSELQCFKNINLQFRSSCFLYFPLYGGFCIVRINFSNRKEAKNALFRTRECVAVNGENTYKFSFDILHQVFFLLPKTEMVAEVDNNDLKSQISFVEEKLLSSL